MRKILWIFVKEVVNLKFLNINYGYDLNSFNKNFDIEGFFENLINCFFFNVVKSEKFVV